MPNMMSVIQKHNKRLLKDKPVVAPKGCNCRKKDECPLGGRCLTSNMVYRACVTSERGSVSYVGICEGSFKQRYSNHKTSFNRRQHINDTELSKYVWSLKEDNVAFNIRWDIEKVCAPYSCGSRKCDLCLWEKVVIGRSEPGSLLNKRAELVSKCRHRTKFLLKQDIT